MTAGGSLKCVFTYFRQPLHVKSRRQVYTLLRDKLRAKMRNEEKASWIDTDLGNVENALEERLWLQKQPKITKRKKIVPKRRKWETESSREPWRDTEKTKERWGREWNSTKSRKSKKWRLHCSIFARKEGPLAEVKKWKTCSYRSSD